jgi:hypothetical protein
VPSRFLSEVPVELIEPVDIESEKALRGDTFLPGKTPEEVLSQVDAEYAEMGADWKVLPGAYKYSENQGGLAAARMGANSRRRTAMDHVAREPSTYAVGQKVKHPKFGPGKIVKIQPAGGGDYFLQINFETEGAKLLSELKAPLERVGEE